MTLPSHPDFDLLLAERPNDQVYAKVKHHFKDLSERIGSLKDELVTLILDDMVFDHALSSAIDEIGVVLEYQAQNEGIERPKFSGTSMLKAAERVSRLRFTSSLCGILEMPDEAVQQIVSAEIGRLWFDGNTEAQNDAKKKVQTPTINLPEEVSTLLREISKSLVKGRNVNKRATTDSGSPSAKPRRAGRKPPSNGGTSGGAE